MPADSTRHEPEITIAPARPNDPDDVDAAVRIGNRSTSTLGLLPIAAYRDAASRGHLLLARLGGHVAAYALYALTRKPARVRLTHLCVSEEHRGHKIARRLVEEISARHGDYPGILARCRRDYELGEMWLKLGFVQRSERPGRGKDGGVLVNWWRDHGHPDLLTRLDDDVLVRAAVDLNILRDLAEPQRADSRDAQSLVDDQVSDRLELVRTPALGAEVDAIDGALRQLCVAQAQRMTPARSAREDADEIRTALLGAAREENPNYPESANDRFDLRHVCDAVSAGLNIFITHDKDLTRLFAPVAEQRFSLRIMHPIDVITHLDELVRAEAYRPAEMLGTAFSSRLLGLSDAAALRQLARSREGERPRAFEDLMRGLVRANRDRVGIVGPDGRLAAVFCAYPNGAELLVPLARVADHSLAETLARQLLFMLRHRAVDEGLDVIRLADGHLSRTIESAALGEGFRAVDDSLRAFALDVCDSADQVGHRAVVAARNTGQQEPPLLRSGMPAVAAAELERAWWPAKITDSLLPSYLVPIQQAFSADLLGVPQTMLAREDALGLSREHVYYRSPAGTTPQAPGRLLWYMSATGRRIPQAAAVVACSQLDTVVTGTPADLHSRFRHLGVWSEERVRQSAHKGLVQALVFTNTEIFPQQISPGRLRVLAEPFGEHHVPYSLRRISNDLFTAIYRTGKAVS